MAGVKVHGFAVSAEESRHIVSHDVVSIFRPLFIKHPHGRSYGFRTTAQGRLAGTSMMKLKQGDFLWIREEIDIYRNGHFNYSSDNVQVSGTGLDREEGYSSNHMPCSASRSTIRIDRLEEFHTEAMKFSDPEQIRMGTLGHLHYACWVQGDDFKRDWDIRWPRTGWRFQDNPIVLRITGRVIHCNVVDVLGNSAPAFLKGPKDE